MKRLPKLATLLIVTFSLAACGGNGPQQSEQADPPDEERTAPATESAATDETNPDDAATEETAAEDTAAQDDSQEAQGDLGGEAAGNDETAGTSVTTLDGERVSVGGGGDATALFFMAGW